MSRIYLIAIVLVVFACKDEKKKHVEDQKQVETVIDSLIFPEESHFKSIRQITFDGDNAEAYWSFDDKQIIFQSNNKNWNVSCDQMFLMDVDETFKDKKPPMVSTGKGRTTCSYFLPDNKHIIYASTHLGDEKCPDTPLRKNGKYI